MLQLSKVSPILLPGKTEASLKIGLSSLLCPGLFFKNPRRRWRSAWLGAPPPWRQVPTPCRRPRRSRPPDAEPDQPPTLAFDHIDPRPIGIRSRYFGPRQTRSAPVAWSMCGLAIGQGIADQRYASRNRVGSHRCRDQDACCRGGDVIGEADLDSNFGRCAFTSTHEACDEKHFSESALEPVHRRPRSEWSDVRSAVSIAWTRAAQLSSKPFRSVAWRVSSRSTMACGCAPTYSLFF